jgi:hypothetical protein
MTPLEIKLSQAINDEIVRQQRGQLGQILAVIDTDQLAQVCTNTIKAEMAAALRASLARREAEVNTAIDEVTK